MPIINMPVDLLLRLVNAERPVLPEAQLSKALDDMGVEVEELTETRVFACLACENVIERTEAQGEALNCPKCGTDFREKPAARKETGKTKVARLNMLAVRPDLFDPGGMARALRGFLGVKTGLIEYAVAPAKLSVQVDPRLARDESYRPHIACAVFRNVRFDHERIKLLMNLQEDLHWALGRDRKLASIGVYDLAKIRTDRPLQYRAVTPDELRFVPLGFSLSDAAASLTPGEILSKHKTGLTYSHLLSKFSAYPLLADGHGTVMSLPPIINSESTRVTFSTQSCFVDVTGLAQRTVDRALNILLSGLKEVIPELQIEAVNIAYAAGAITTPDFSPAEMVLDPRLASDTVGVDFAEPQLRRLLERMGHGVESRPSEPDAPARGPGRQAAQGMPPAGGSGSESAEGSGDASDSKIRTLLRVRVPAWRNDIMHPIDLIEDVAVAFGYDKLSPQLVPTFTVGSARAIEEKSAIVRRIFTGLGFHQVMTLVLTNEASAFDKWGVPHDPRAVKIENPISNEQTMCRVSLLPGIVETLTINKQYDLPQHLFEVGDCCFVDPQSETGAREERHVAAAMIGPHVGFADIRAVMDAFSHEMGADISVRATESPAFLAGRCAGLFVGDRQIGTMGELHPRCLESCGLRHAVAAMELNLAALA